MRIGNEVANTARSALEQVANRITELSVTQLPFNDPLNPLNPAPRPQPIPRSLRYALLLGATALVAILVETAANLLAAELGTHLPTGAAATLTLIPALILLLALSRRLEC